MFDIYLSPSSSLFLSLFQALLVLYKFSRIQFVLLQSPQQLSRHSRRLLSVLHFYRRAEIFEECVHRCDDAEGATIIDVHVVGRVDVDQAVQRFARALGEVRTAVRRQRRQVVRRADVADDGRGVRQHVEQDGADDEIERRTVGRRAEER